MLPKDAKERKKIPIARGFLDYFPDAICAVAEVSRIGNEQHNPGEPIHWAKGKSTDHADALLRHLMERGEIDFVVMPSGETVAVRHTAQVAWRAMALLQTELENEQREADMAALTWPAVDTRTGLATRPPEEPRYKGPCPSCDAKPGSPHDECCTWTDMPAVPMFGPPPPPPLMFGALGQSLAPPPPPPMAPLNACMFDSGVNGACLSCGAAWKAGEVRPEMCIAYGTRLVTINEDAHGH